MFKSVTAPELWKDVTDTHTHTAFYSLGSWVFSLWHSVPVSTHYIRTQCPHMRQHMSVSPIFYICVIICQCLLTSTRVAPVARKLLTRIISPMAAMLAPRITNASWVGSTLTQTLDITIRDVYRKWRSLVLRKSQNGAVLSRGYIDIGLRFGTLKVESSVYVQAIYQKL